MPLRRLLMPALGLSLLAACGDDGDAMLGDDDPGLQDAAMAPAPPSPTPAPPPAPPGTLDAGTPDAGDSEDEDAGMAPPEVELPPTNAFDLRDWLMEGNYLDWPAESSVHDSTGPHFGGVRTFVTPALLASLEAGNGAHPEGAATVKELYGDGDTLRGWAVSLKRAADSDNGGNWFWYEFYDGSPVAAGNGVALCTNCHGGGVDFVLTPTPLQ